MEAEQVEKEHLELRFTADLEVEQADTAGL
jgi:hypothetical protein